MSDPKSAAQIVRQLGLHMRLNGILLEVLIAKNVLNRAEAGALIDEVTMHSKEYGSDLDPHFDQGWQQLRDQFR